MTNLIIFRPFRAQKYLLCKNIGLHPMLASGGLSGLGLKILRQYEIEFDEQYV